MTLAQDGVTREQREQRYGQRGLVVWLTGLPGAGKTTIARALEGELLAHGRLTFLLDGDDVRRGLNADLGFSPHDRNENVRRIGAVAALMADAGLVALVAVISPYRAGRREARQAAGPGRFLEVFVDTPLEVCEARDPKGLYRRARTGKLADFTGVSAPYEAPDGAELVLHTATMSIDRCVAMLHALVEQHLALPDRSIDAPTAGRKT